MAEVLATKACRACAAAKRKCEKQRPRCQRCKTRGIECIYPPTQPSSFILIGGDDAPALERDVLPCSGGPQLPRRTQSCPGGEAGYATLGLSLDLSDFYPGLIDDQQASSWFTSPETWQVSHIPANPASLCSVELKRHIETFHGWFAEWVDKGSNPFVHSMTYRNRFPHSIQDAYTTLTSYLHRTPFNKQIITRIVEDQARRLLAENSAGSCGSSSNNNSAKGATLDPLEHVARVQALLVYQFIGLYDGDIRLRHLAESHSRELNTWMMELVASTSQAPNLGVFLASSTHEEAMALSIEPGRAPYDDENMFWYSWIMAETVRRTWVMATGVQAIYYIIQQGHDVPCQGGMVFTTRRGVWEAQSAFAWEEICSKVNIGLMQMKDTDKLFAKVAPQDINDFAKVVLEIMFGSVMMERWGL